MYTVVRIYKGAPELADSIAAHGSDVKAMMEGVSGFKSYELIKTNDGAISVTSCLDRAGCDASSKIAGDWLRANLPGVVSSPPEVLYGESILAHWVVPAAV